MRVSVLAAIFAIVLVYMDIRACQGQREYHVPPLREQLRQHQQQPGRSEIRQRQHKQHNSPSTARNHLVARRSTPPSVKDQPQTPSRYLQEEAAEFIYDDGYQQPAIVAQEQPAIVRPIVHVRDSDGNCTNDTTIINKVLTGYNKHKLPDSDGVIVKVEFWIQEISSVSEISNDFEMDIYINEMWLDKALRFDDMNPCKHNISLSHQVFDRLWTPNSCFINSKQASIHDSPFRNIFLMIYPNGTVWANYRVKVKGPCDMDLSKFPMDVQKCSLVYESFSYNRAEVKMQWGDREDPVYPLKNFTLPDFVLIHMTNSSGTVVYPAGQWDELYATFTFQRRYMWYILQAYIPTYLTIFISWISFTLGAKAIPARTMLGVNSLLAMIMMFGNIMKNLPRVSYVKAIDVWMLACMTFNFCSLLELAIVGYMTKDPSPCKGGSVSAQGSNMAHAATGAVTGAANVAVGVNAVLGASATYMTGKKLCRHYHPNQCQPQGSIDSQRMNVAHERAMNRYIFDERKSTGCLRHCRNMFCPAIWTAEKIDKASCFAFPALFSLFNIAYWSFYMQT